MDSSNRIYDILLVLVLLFCIGFVIYGFTGPPIGNLYDIGPGPPP